MQHWTKFNLPIFPIIHKCATKKNQNKKKTNLELGGFHGDGYADEEDSEHGDGGVSFPVLGPAVGAAGHAPDFGSEVLRHSMAAAMLAADAAHRNFPGSIRSNRISRSKRSKRP